MESKPKTHIDPVSVVKNWRTRVRHEQQSADQWQQDWGFLASGAQGLKTEDALKIYTIDDKIRLVQEVRFREIFKFLATQIMFQEWTVLHYKH